MSHRKLTAAVVAVAIVVLGGGVAWAQSGETRGAGSFSGFVPLDPCRIVDTRQGGGGILNPGTKRTYRAWDNLDAFGAQGGKHSPCGVPSAAGAIEVTITAVDPAGTGFLRAFPGAAAAPQATFLNYSTGVDISNTGTIRITPSQLANLGVQAYGASTHVVIDVQGYYDGINT